MCKKKYGTDVALNLHIKRNHKGGNKSDREKYAREVFLALKAGTAMPTTELVVPDEFIKTIKEEFVRLKKEGFDEEFEPTNIFRYNISNFDQIMDSLSDEDADNGAAGKSGFFEDNDSKMRRDSISVNGNRFTGGSVMKDDFSDVEDKMSDEGGDVASDGEGSVISRT